MMIYRPGIMPGLVNQKNQIVDVRQGRPEMKGILGADIFVNLLLVFIIATGLLFMNTNKSSDKGIDHQGEKNLPKIQLATGQSESASLSENEKTVNLSAKKQGTQILYYINDILVDHRDLKKQLQDQQAHTVKIRFDERMEYGRYIEILDLCRQCGVSNISNVYTTSQEE